MLTVSMVQKAVATQIFEVKTRKFACKFKRWQLQSEHVYNKSSNYLNLGVGKVGLREEIFVDQFSEPQGANCTIYLHWYHQEKYYL